MKFIKTLLATTVGVSLLVANVTASKIAYFDLPLLGEAAIPAGFLGIAVAFLATDILGESYGKEAARHAVNSAVAGLAIGYAMVYASVLMPAAPFYPHAEAFETILLSSTSVFAASLLTLGVSQNVDVEIFHRLKRRTGIKAVRNVGSTAISQLIDTALFIGLAFVLFPRFLSGTATAIDVAAGMVVAQYAVKLAVALADTPLFYLLTRFTDGQ